MDDDKTRFYEDEAVKCRRMAADESCGDAREYYEALERDFIKLASLEQRRIHAISPDKTAEKVD